jgi:hypothetical protein
LNDEFTSPIIEGTPYLIKKINFPADPYKKTTKNPTAGITKEYGMPYISAIFPIIYGEIAPPITDIITIGLAFHDFSPKFFIESEKIVGNIIDMKKNVPIIK